MLAVDDNGFEVRHIDSKASGGWRL
jgi:hypothetical protein